MQLRNEPKKLLMKKVNVAVLVVKMGVAHS